MSEKEDVPADYGAEEEEGQAVGGDLFTNNHDLIGVQGIVRAQKNEIEKKKVRCVLLKGLAA